jgi:CheY-like chemotaxis protein
MPNDPPHYARRPVLIVDDVVSEAMTLDLLCRSFGVETICATSAEEAAAILARTRPAAIITGLAMPGADGLDWLFMIAKRVPGVPVLVLTGSKKPLLKAAGELCDNYGLSDLVCCDKTIDINTLRTFVARAGLPIGPSQWDLH